MTASAHRIDCRPLVFEEPLCLAPAFAALDRVLAVALKHQSERLGSASLLDPWLGMHRDLQDLQRILAESPLVKLVDDDGMISLLTRLARRAPRFAYMADLLDLCDVDVLIVLLAIAPEIDLRYERVFGYLQDDLTRKRPGFDLAANLFCAKLEERLEWLARLDPAAPLTVHGVLVRDPTPGAPLATQMLTLDAQWRNFLLGRSELDPGLSAVATLRDASPRGLERATVDEATRSLLRRHVRAASNGDGNVRLVLIGPHGAGKNAIASAVAHESSLRLLVIDVRSLAHPADAAATLARAERASRLLPALLYFHGASSLASTNAQMARALCEALATLAVGFVLSLTEPLPQMHVRALRAERVLLGLPSAPVRLGVWRESLALNAVEASTEDIEFVATQFKLSSEQIEQTAVDVSVRLGAERRTRCTRADLGAAARQLCGDELSRLAQRVSPKANFSSLISNAEVMSQLQEIRDRVMTQARVLMEWPPHSVHVRRAGLSVMFAGPSGTGKTLAAEALAFELGLDLFRIDLSAVVSKYIGETEKNLSRVFAAAETANAVLFFDEADALFGKRSEVKDAHDRHANVEVAYLLQKIEQFEGIAILASNLRQNLDGAFARRLAFCVNFAFPEEVERERLWEAMWPMHVERAGDVDLGWFAREFALSGGNIRNAIVAAAHLAAAQGTTIAREHLLHATKREYQKLGKNLAMPVLPVSAMRVNGVQAGGVQ